MHLEIVRKLARSQAIHHTSQGAMNCATTNNPQFESGQSISEQNQHEFNNRRDRTSTILWAKLGRSSINWHPLTDKTCPEFHISDHKR